MAFGLLGDHELAPAYFVGYSYSGWHTWRGETAHFDTTGRVGRMELHFVGVSI